MQEAADICEKKKKRFSQSYRQNKGGFRKDRSIFEQMINSPCLQLSTQSHVFKAIKFNESIWEINTSLYLKYYGRNAPVE